VWTDLISITQQAKLVSAVNDSLVLSQRSAMRLKRFSFPIVCSIRARSLYSFFGKKRPRSLEFSLRGMTGVTPRARAASRLGRLSYPLSVIATRGVMSGPRSSEISNCVVSLTSPPVRWKSSGLPSRSVLRWIFVEKPPRERPSA
jgi:hypothetical protein